MRRAVVERLENRELFALNIVSITPPDGATDVARDTDLVIEFNETALKGQGNIHVVDAATGTLGVAVDVNSPNVQVAGSTVTIDLPTDLEWETNYFVLIDDGAFKDADTTLFPNSTLMLQDFELLPLFDYVQERGGDGTDYTLDPPLGFSIDNSNMAGPGMPEWQGWSFADKNSWIDADNQNRSQFTLGTGTVAIADPDEWDDAFAGSDVHGNFNSIMYSKPILLDGVTSNSLELVFDSSYRPEDQQIGTLDVTFDNGATWNNLLTYNSPDMNDNQNLSETLTFSNMGNPSTGEAQFRWQMIGGNDWWWALDNIRVSGEIPGDTFEGITAVDAWEFATPPEPILSISIDASAIIENGGTATGTVSRNLDTTDALTVTLASSDTTEATVPAEVVIPAGAASATFTITAVDDAELDRNQVATITATSGEFTPGVADITILDDELPILVATVPADDATGVFYQTNLEATFSVDVKKGQGRIYVVDAATGVAEYTLDVSDSSVSISGPTLTVQSPGNLRGQTDYYILIEDGAILDNTNNVFEDATLLVETFDLLQLGPAVSESAGDGTDWTDSPPLGFSVEDQISGAAGAPEWEGWGFADAGFWVDAQGDGRDSFTRGAGNVAVADIGAWADIGDDASRNYTTSLITKGIDLSGVAASSVRLSFDSGYVDGNANVIGDLAVSYNDGASWTSLAFFDGNSANGEVVIDSTTAVGSNVGGAQILAQLNNPGSGIMKFRFQTLLGNQSGWWAIDNIHVTGDVSGLPFTGIADPTTWNFRTDDARTITVTTASPSVMEGAGTLTGTVSRNLDTVGAVTVDLMSSDTSEATVPAQVTIPDGQASVDFVITIIDDTIADGAQTVTISANAPADFFVESTDLVVLDNDFPMITSVDPVDGATNIAVDSKFTVDFDQDVKKGNGFVHILRVADGKTGISIDVNSPQVTITGGQVDIFPTMDLGSLTDYYVAIDPGAILGAADGVNTDVVLLKQDFETLPLGAAADESGGDGTDFTLTPPTGYSIDNSNMSTGGVTEWRGWSFADKDFWAQAGGQDRVSFTKGTGTVAVADSDEFDDLPNSGPFNSLFHTVPIQLGDVQANSVQLAFDSDFRAEGSQEGFVEVTFDAGANWTRLLTLNPTDGRDERVMLDVANPNGGVMEIRFGYTGSNNWWWAIDNMEITGDVNGLPFPGISTTDTTTWNVSTVDTSTFPQLSSVAPADDSTDVAVDSNLSITFNTDVKKGNGSIHILRASDGKVGASVDVNSAAVTIAGSVVTIDPPADLKDATEYVIKIDNGAILSLANTAQVDTTLLLQDFETLPLGPENFETGGDGTDFTVVPPSGFTVDNTNMASAGVPEWRGWSFADKDFWAQAGGQDRSAFTLGTGTVAVADSDEFDDNGDPDPFDSNMRTPAIQLDNVTANSVTLEFDSSFRPEGSQQGLLDVSFDGGSTWSNVLTLDTQDDRNTRYAMDINNPDTGTMEFRFSYTGANNWWWAIDNIRVTGDTAGLPYLGLEDMESWTFTTQDRRPAPTAFGPADNTNQVPVGSNLSITFDRDVKKGNGLLHIMNAADGKSDISIDVNSAAVTINGAVVTIDPPEDLVAESQYFVSFDEGAIVSVANSQADATLLWQDFETLRLGAAVDETGGDGTDFTLTPPTGYMVDNTNMATGGVTEWRGWSFADNDFWAQAGGQDRSNFRLGSGTVAIADSDEFDDIANSGPFNSLFHTVPIQLGDVAANSVTLQFDSSFRPEADQTGLVDVTFDGGANWTNILTLGPTNPLDDRNARYQFDIANPDTGAMEFRFSYTGQNNWWWAIDNIKVTGDISGVQSPGIANTDSSTWNFWTESTDTAAPVVTSVIAASTAWTTAFIDTVDGAGAGNGNGIGYEVAAGEGPLPWNNLDRVYVQFSEAIGNPSPSNFELRDSEGIVATALSYDPDTFRAVFAIDTALGFNKFRLGVSDQVVDLVGNQLDGDSNGTSGGIFDFRFDVVPADGNRDGRVNGSDLAVFSAAFLTQAGAADYNPFADWNADDRVNGSDLAVFSANFLNNIDTVADPAGAFSGNTGGDTWIGGGKGDFGGGYSGGNGFDDTSGTGDDSDFDGVDGYFGSLGDDEEEDDNDFFLM